MRPGAARSPPSLQAAMRWRSVPRRRVRCVRRSAACRQRHGRQGPHAMTRSGPRGHSPPQDALPRAHRAALSWAREESPRRVGAKERRRRRLWRFGGGSKAASSTAFDQPGGTILGRRATADRGAVNHLARRLLSIRACDPRRDLLPGRLSVRRSNGPLNLFFFIIITDLSACSLNPIFDVETEYACLRSSKIRFGELQPENGPKSPLCTGTGIFAGPGHAVQVAPVPSCIAGTVLLIVDWQKSPDRLRSLVLVAPELVVERELLRSDCQRARRDTDRRRW